MADITGSSGVFGVPHTNDGEDATARRWAAFYESAKRGSTLQEGLAGRVDGDIRASTAIAAEKGGLIIIHRGNPPLREKGRAALELVSRHVTHQKLDVYMLNSMDRRVRRTRIGMTIVVRAHPMWAKVLGTYLLGAPQYRRTWLDATCPTTHVEFMERGSGKIVASIRGLCVCEKSLNR